MEKQTDYGEWERYRARDYGEWEQYRAKAQPSPPPSPPPRPGLLEQVGQGALETGKSLGTVWGPAETAANLATQTYGVPASGLAQLAGLPFGLETSQKWGKAVQDFLIYQPQTRAGQQLTGAVAYPFQKLGGVAERVGELGTEWTESPLMGTAMGTALQASPLLMGMRGRPGVSKLTPEQLQVARSVEKYKMPISPKEYVPTKSAKVLQAAADWFPTGRVWTSVKRGQLESAILRMREDIFGKMPGIKEATESIKARAQIRMRDLLTEMQETSKSGYRGFREAFGAEGVVIPMEKTVGIIEKYRGKVPQGQAFLEMFSKKRQGSAWNVETIDLFQKQVYKKIGKKQGYIGHEIINALKEDISIWDITRGEKAVKFLEAARNQWRESVILNKNPFVREFISRHGNMKKAMERATVDEIRAVLKAVDKETAELMKTNLLQELIDDSSIKTVEGAGNAFLPGRFAENFFKLENRIKKTMPEIYPQTRDFALTMRAVVNDMKKAGKGEGWWLGSALMGGLTYAQPVIGVPVLGFSLVTAKSLMNPRGWFRKWTTGYKGEKLPLMAPGIKRGVGIGMAAQTIQEEPTQKGLAKPPILGPRRQFEEEYGFPAQ